MRSIFAYFHAALLALTMIACSNSYAAANDNSALRATLSNNLRAAGIKAAITNVRATELPNLYWISLSGMPPVYATADGKYIIQGEVVRLEKGGVYNLSDNLQQADNKGLLKQIAPNDTINYRAKGATKAVVYVFTDATCPYCHKLHGELNAMNAKGIEVRYVPWPRAQQYLPINTAIWCSQDRAAAFNAATQGLPVNAPACKNNVLTDRQIGMQIGVDGTPAIYNSDGTYLGGYMPADELAKRLGL